LAGVQSIIALRLGANPSPAAAKTLFILEKVVKKAGISAAGERLPVPAKENQPWAPNAEQKTLIDQMREPFLELTTIYNYIDKKSLIEAHDAGVISDEIFDQIKTTVTGSGLDWDALPDVYEAYAISGLGSWKYPEP
jgi:hypothetical protein